MLHPNIKYSINKQLDSALLSSKNWPEDANKYFVDLVERNREHIVNDGDFSFISQLIEHFKITEPSQPIENTVSLETRFIMAMQRIYTHFHKIQMQTEHENKRNYYLQMLRSGQKDVFSDLMKKEFEIHNEKMKANIWGTGNPEAQLMHSIFMEFQKEEKAKKDREEQIRRQEMVRIHEEKMKIIHIENEAKRRIEMEDFERKVQEKMRELRKPV